jgi:hypothetical protein
VEFAKASTDEGGHGLTVFDDGSAGFEVLDWFGKENGEIHAALLEDDVFHLNRLVCRSRASWRQRRLEDSRASAVARKFAASWGVAQISASPRYKFTRS